MVKVSVVSGELIYGVDLTGNPNTSSVYEITEEEYIQQRDLLSELKAYFAIGEDTIVIFLGVSSSPIEGYSYIYDVGDVDLDKINLFYTVLRNAETEALSYVSNATSDEEELRLKTEEMYVIIENNYSIRDMIYVSILNDYDPLYSGISDIKTYLSGIMLELATNGKDADFTARL